MYIAVIHIWHVSSKGFEVIRDYDEASVKTQAFDRVLEINRQACRSADYIIFNASCSRGHELVGPNVPPDIPIPPAPADVFGEEKKNRGWFRRLFS